MVLSDLQEKMTSSHYVMSLAPGAEFDAKITYETGMAVLLNKPILVIVQPGDEHPNEGLLRIATVVLRLTEPLETMTGQAELLAAMAQMDEAMDGA